MERSFEPPSGVVGVLEPRFLRCFLLLFERKGWPNASNDVVLLGFEGVEQISGGFKPRAAQAVSKVAELGE